MQLPVVMRSGEADGTIEAEDSVFDIEPNTHVMHQVLLAQLANRRAGTASTKTRGEVRGSTVKLFRQKGLGRARQGSVRAPHRRHGGIVFGPKPRKYTQRIAKMVRRLAIRSALSAAARGGSLVVVRDLSIEEPKTRVLREILQHLNLNRSTLVVTAAADETVKRCAANLPEVKTLPAPYLNIADLTSHRGLLMTVDAVRQAEAQWGGERATRRRAPLRAAAGGAGDA
ncbi:MAG TPA: 50S ribosomal protein L4 [Dehalococcoidia bacterium]|nr:50S ribosomal protein L4 [Dehalococcoidia bacterium]